MRPWVTHAAIVATLIVPLLSGPAAAQRGPSPRPAPAYALVERLLAHRAELALDTHQTAKLTQLAQQLRTHPSRLRITGRTAPGKASHRVEREPISRQEATRRALRVLTPEQRIVAARAVESDDTNMAQR
jgi:Spy/CpxP family protein refolding chaperone